MINSMRNIKEFNLIDYKGKFTIIQDYVDGLDYPVGKITNIQAIAEAETRKARARYYGVPAYIGEDKELKKIFK